MQPAQRLKLLQQIRHKTTYFGPQGFSLPRSDDELKQFQQGFSALPDGTDLSGVNAGDWQQSWLVIAIDTELGDPYFVDCNDTQPAVFTAILTETGWQVDAVATSLDGFLECLNLLTSYGNQSSALLLPDESTIVDKTTLAQLQDSLVKASGCADFWALFFECYLDWLQDDDS